MKNIKLKCCEYDMPLVDFEKKEANEERCDYDSQPCIICGKAIKEGLKKEWLRMFDGGGYVTSNMEIPDDELPNDMGCFPAGITCFNRYKKLEKEVEFNFEKE